MKPAMRVAMLAVALGAGTALAAEPLPRTEVGNGEESSRSFTLRSVYYPFLAVGHGILLVAQYGVGYPIYYLSKPAIDFMYTSSDEATDVPSAAALNSRNSGRR